MQTLSALASSGKLSNLKNLTIEDYTGDLSFIACMEQLTGLEIKRCSLDQPIDFKPLLTLFDLALKKLSFPSGEPNHLDLSENTQLNDLWIEEIINLRKITFPKVDGLIDNEEKETNDQYSNNEIDVKESSNENESKGPYFLSCTNIKLTNCQIENLYWLYLKSDRNEQCIDAFFCSTVPEEPIPDWIKTLILKGSVEDVLEILSHKITAKSCICRLEIEFTAHSADPPLLVKLQKFRYLSQLILSASDGWEDHITILLIEECPCLSRISNNFVATNIHVDFGVDKIFLQGMKIEQDKINNLSNLRILQLENVKIESDVFNLENFQRVKRGQVWQIYF